jgi:plasmid stabilization system protein ParE
VSLRFVFSKEALETYAAIQLQLFDRFGDKILKKFEQKTVKTLDLILISPLMFKAVAENPNLRKGIIHQNCSVYYEIKPNFIEVLFFWDNRQEPLL